MTEIITKTAILLLSCKDMKRLVYKITNFIYKIGGNIYDLAEDNDSLKYLIKKGRDFDRTVLARALLLHRKYQILVTGNKTIVF